VGLGLEVPVGPKNSIFAGRGVCWGVVGVGPRVVQQDGVYERGLGCLW